MSAADGVTRCARGGAARRRAPPPALAPVAPDGSPDQPAPREATGSVRRSSRPPCAASEPPAGLGVLNAVLRRPLLEHRAGKAKVAADPNAREALGTGRVSHPRRTHVEQGAACSTSSSGSSNERTNMGSTAMTTPELSARSRVHGAANRERRHPCLLRSVRLEVDPVGPRRVPSDWSGDDSSEFAGKNTPALAYNGVREALCDARESRR